MSDEIAMTSQRPYLLRAMWDWISDNGLTPYLLVDAMQPGVRVPPHTVQDGRVVLNVADRAVGQLELGDEAIRFHARFGGVSHPVSVPVAAVIAIYARENGQGMALPGEADAQAGRAQTGVAESTGGEGGQGAPAATGEPARPALRPVGTDADASMPPTAPPDDDDPPPRRGGHLRVVK